MSWPMVLTKVSLHGVPHRIHTFKPPCVLASGEVHNLGLRTAPVVGDMPSSSHAVSCQVHGGSGTTTMAELERCRLQQLLILSPSAARVVGDNVKPLEERLHRCSLDLRWSPRETPGYGDGARPPGEDQSRCGQIGRF
jgi:hypothetical protein